MPMLEHLGLRVIEERPTRLVDGTGETWLQDFGVLGPTDRPLDLDEAGERIADCIAAVWRGEAESDSLNRLVITTSLDWRQVAVLRAYRKYRQRLGSRFTESYQHDVIAANPHITEKQVQLFERRFDPARERDEAAEAALREEILEDLDAVASLDHDRILRNQLGLIEATVRTNAYRGGRRALAFKVRSAEVPAMPQPAPLFEIYIYSPDVEGIHLRGGKIARGGIRWSDRMDYRTEVFGLMRAQMTKNAVIVPDGAKGGFHLTRRPEDPAELRAEVERQYVTYISGLLDVTDNLVDGEVVHPEGVRVLDDDDTYLVVAADKGTATLSDTANRVAERYGFWLGDAFASGGSNGYDHKALGITARGAWESLKRHFRELDIDPRIDAFTVVGIGDMSGDVFGNGMLLSDRIRLVAAYDHRHIFIDPDPDPDRGFAERKRLFELAGSSWDDYDRDAISEGGGVWPRSAKSIPLSPEIRAALGVEDEALAPTDVIRAILRAPVDVLWNGGIGTVVKASFETDADAHDRSSDAIRVDASDLRCRVVAEGGNLGFTQRARIEFAAGGGRINADFIDNSAGVDCSDHEVNLKILLNVAVRPRRARRRRAATSCCARSPTTSPPTSSTTRSCRRRSSPRRSAASAGRDVRLRGPDGRAGGRGPARPRHRVPAELGGDGRAPPREPRPRAARARGPARLRQARADRRAAALRPAGGAVPRSARCATTSRRSSSSASGTCSASTRCGASSSRRSSPTTSSTRSGRRSSAASWPSSAPSPPTSSAPTSPRATSSTRLGRWEAIERLDRSVDRGAQWELMEGLDRARRGDGPLVPQPRRARVRPARRRSRTAATRSDELAEILPSLGAEEWREEREQVAAELVEQGVPGEMARDHAFRRALEHAPDIVAIARLSGRTVEEVARAFFRLGQALQLTWLEREIEAAAGRPRGCSAGRCRPCATTSSRRAGSSPSARCATRRTPRPTRRSTTSSRPTRRASRASPGFTRALAGEGADLAGLTLAVRQLRALVDCDRARARRGRARPRRRARRLRGALGRGAPRARRRPRRDVDGRGDARDARDELEGVVGRTCATSSESTWRPTRSPTPSSSG